VLKPQAVRPSGSRCIGRGRRAWRLGARIGLICALAQPAWSDLPSVEILAVGQHVERLGVLGSFGHTLCLGSDGRVGTSITGGEGPQALTCGDATGFTAVVRTGEPSPRGGPFVEFTDCALPGDGALYFSATRLAPPYGDLTEDVYRATAEGIEWVVGPGAVATDGTQLRQILALNGSNVRSWSVFEVNDRGTVLVRTQDRNGAMLVRVRPRRDPEALRTGYFGSGAPFLNGTAASLAGDDSVLGIATLPSGEPAIGALDGNQVRVLFTLADVLGDIGLGDAFHHFRFFSLVARGDLVSLRIEYYRKDTLPSESHRLYLLYRPPHGFAPFIDPAVYDDVWVMDFTPGGRTLIAGYSYGDRSSEDFSDNLVIDDSGPTLVSREGPGGYYAFPNALTLNDRGNVLLQTRGGSSSMERRSLALTGPAPEARCFVPPTAVEPSPPPTRTQTPTRTRVPTFTPTPPVECTARAEQCAHLRVGAVAGAPGDRVSLAVTLDPGPWSVVGLQGDVRLSDHAAVAVTEAGEPACRVDPAIGKSDSRFGFLPAFCGDDCTHVRALVLSFTDVEPIPNGATVFACDLHIDAAALPGVYPLTLDLPNASDRYGNQLPIASQAGALTVRGASDASVGLTAPSAGEGGCQVGPHRAHGFWVTLALAAIARAARELSNRARRRPANGSPRVR
jgi:hypothetical protein